jgi:uncharacterized protein YjbI with pentapeptide repeats
MTKNELIQLLKADVAGFNEYRRKNPGPLDLSKADLIGADLTEADLTEADLTETNLSGARLFMADLTKADLTKADLTGATGLEQAILFDVRWPYVRGVSREVVEASICLTRATIKFSV